MSEQTFTADQLTPEMMQVIGTVMQQSNKNEQARKVQNFKYLNQKVIPGSILFTGSSLMEHFPICEMAESAGLTEVIYNRGIGGTTTDDFLREIDTVLLDVKPAKVFINIGTNDMTDRVYGAAWMDHLIDNYRKILEQVKEKLPETKVYCMAYYPTNHHLPDQNEFVKSMLAMRTKENIAECNRRVKELAESFGYRYIDVNDGLTDENGEQKREFAIEGVHMYANAYYVVFNNVLPYIKE